MVDLSRFTSAHQKDFETAYREISNGRKETHWMWYIFPQIFGLGKRTNSDYYAIKSAEEARAFLADPYLGGNLRAICRAVLRLQTNRASEVFQGADVKKLRSCMTLFSYVSEGESVFDDVLFKFFRGVPDDKTIKILEQSAK